MKNMHDPKADCRGAVERRDPCNSSSKDYLALWQHQNVPPNLTPHGTNLPCHRFLWNI